MAFSGRRMYPWWHYAPMQYIEDTDTTYCERHKNKCNEGCPYRRPRRRTTPSPLSVAMPGYGDPRFGYGYGMLGVEESDMAGIERGGPLGGLGGPHHHGHRRGGMSYYGWSTMPWWYGPPAPTEYTIEETSSCPLHGNKCDSTCPERVTTRRRVPTGAANYGGSYGSLGDNHVLGDDFGVLNRTCPSFGSLNRRYRSDYGSLGTTPAPAPATTISNTGAKVGLAAVAAVAAGLLFFAGK